MLSSDFIVGVSKRKKPFRNEPDFATPYHYNYINKQYKSVNQSRLLANQYFHDEMYGLPGNSDAGALNSWLVWHMLGIYPIVTQPVYLIESPWFTDINMTINGNATLRITSNGDAPSLGHTGYYVQSVKINGQEWSKNVSDSLSFAPFACFPLLKF